MTIGESEGRPGLSLRGLACVSVLVCAVAAPMPALAQPAPAPQNAPAIRPPAMPPAPSAGTASLSRSAVRALTYKISTALSGLALFTYGTGSVVGGLGLTAFNTVQSSLVFTGVDYAYDLYWPKPQSTNESFDLPASAERNTWKYFIYRSMSTPVKFLSLYLYTGSAATTLGIGTASFVVNTVFFYTNNVIWDWVDWTGVTGPAAPAPVSRAQVAELR